MVFILIDFILLLILLPAIIKYAPHLAPIGIIMLILSGIYLYFECKEICKDDSGHFIDY